MLQRSIFSSFPHYFIYIFLTSGVKLHIHLLLKCDCSIHCFPHSLSTLICRGTDISKCFSESLGIRDNESRLYIGNGYTFKDGYFVGYITKTCLYYFDPLKTPLLYSKTYTLFFLIMLKTIACGHSLEPPRRGGFNEYLQSIFLADI